MREKLEFFPKDLDKKVWTVEKAVLDDELTDVIDIQRLNDRKGDDKWLGWLRRGCVIEGIKKGDALVIRDDGKIVAFLIGNSRKDGKGRVSSICVAEEYRRYGLGKILMKYFLEKQSEKTVFLKVMHLNTAGIYFFTKIGGVPINTEINKHNNVLIEFEFNKIV